MTEPSTHIATIDQTKHEFIKNVQKWVIIDSQSKIVHEKTKQLRQYKTELSSSICNYIQENDLGKTKLEITDGEIKMFEKKDYAPLTFGYIEEILGKIMKEPNQVEYIIQKLKENRKITSHHELRRV